MVIIKHSGRFLLFLLVQTLLLNQIEFGIGIHVMIYPLFILLLPIDINQLLLMLIAFVFGISVDAISNTYGLHASSAVFIAYLRPVLLKLFEPRDGYDTNVELNFFNMGVKWTLYVLSVLLLVHHLWFFTLEIFKFNELEYILLKTIVNLPISFAICFLIQIIFIKKQKSRK
jgi:hypothetical protein